MEIRIMYPEIISHSLIVAFIFLFAWRKRKKFKNGVIVANTKYVKGTPYYKLLKFKYVLYNFIIVVVCISLIGISATITARLYKEDRKEEIKEYHNRDIILCFDLTSSVYGVVNEVIDYYIELVQNMKGDRFGIVAFAYAPSTILPLTDDYNYALSILEKMKHLRWSDLDLAGVNYPKCCMDSDGDGLATSVMNFDKDDKRTKVVILTADHAMAEDSYIVSLNEAADLAKEYGVKVYYIDGENPSTKKNNSESTQQKIYAAEVTGGKYYDAQSLSVKQIINDIDNLDKTTHVEKNVEIIRVDLPELLFPYLIYLVIILFLLDWRVRL